MRKTYKVKIECSYFGITYKAGDRIALSGFEKDVFETQNVNCLGEVVKQQVKSGTAVVEVAPLDAAAIESTQVKKVPSNKKLKKKA